MNNRVANPNPFGSLTKQELEKFQKETGLSLPIDYANCLLKYNGAEFEKCIYDEGTGPYEDAVVHQMYGLHTGPAYARLQDGYKLYQYYDLATFRHDLAHYFVFAMTSTGNLLMLDLRDGSVCHFQADMMQ